MGMCSGEDGVLGFNEAAGFTQRKPVAKLADHPTQFELQ